MGRRIETLKLDDEQTLVTCEALPYEQAEDLLPEIAEIVSTGFSSFAAMFADGELNLTDSVDAAALGKILPGLGGLAKQLGGGRLRRLAPKILAGTTVILTDDKGEKTKYDLCNASERADCFETRPDLYLRLLIFAGQTTFGRFFSGGAKSGSKAPPKSA